MKWMSRIMWMLSALLPKRNTAAVHTWPSYDDTAQALIPELEKSRLDKIYYLAAADIVAGSAPTWGPKVVVLPKRSLRAASITSPNSRAKSPLQPTSNTTQGSSPKST